MAKDDIRQSGVAPAHRLALPGEPGRGVVQGHAHRAPQGRARGGRGDPHGAGGHARPERPGRDQLLGGPVRLAQQVLRLLRHAFRPKGPPHRARADAPPRALHLRLHYAPDVGRDRLLGLLLREFGDPADVPCIPRRQDVPGRRAGVRGHREADADPPGGPRGGKGVHAAPAPGVPGGAREAQGEHAPVLPAAVRHQVGFDRAAAQPRGRLQRHAVRVGPLPVPLEAPRVPPLPAIRQHILPAALRHRDGDAQAAAHTADHEAAREPQLRRSVLGGRSRRPARRERPAQNY
mmetsp:Transcript_26424/g.74588  ORF Transcript_26424/g.74588 Transcript_26424/m.74588 type:complete len:291 (+) Transcript_26424:1110-1982(+)